MYTTSFSEAVSQGRYKSKLTADCFKNSRFSYIYSNPGTKRQYRYRHNEKKWSPLVILTCSLGCQWIRCWRKICGQSQKLAVSDVGWISRWRNHGWGSAMPTLPTCISVWLKWNPRLQVFPMRQRLIQLTSETASFWLRPPILRQHLIHHHPRPQACSTQLLQVLLRLPIY